MHGVRHHIEETDTAREAAGEEKCAGADVGAEQPHCYNEQLLYIVCPYGAAPKTASLSENAAAQQAGAACRAAVGRGSRCRHQSLCLPPQ